MNIFLQILFLLVAVNGFALQQTPRCKLPDGITDFEKMRDKNFCYIDKTGFILKMFQTDLVYFFIARPRKFGKTLFCKTIESVLWGEKQLFEGLAIHDSYDWTPHPVIYLDFANFGGGSENAHDYARYLVATLKEIPRLILKKRQDKTRNTQIRINADGLDNTDVQGSLRNLVYSLREAFSSNVGIVIDEYDSLVTKNIQKPKLVTDVCEKVLQPFYSTIKSLENELRFVFITGITRFTQSYLFSSMNKLKDISQYEDYSDMLGFTEDEMKIFAPEIKAVVKYRKETFKEHVTTKSQKKEIQEYYDGYKFTAGGPTLYHPSFLMTYLDAKDHSMVKDRIPEPKFLFDILPTRLYSPSLIMGINVTADDLRGITDPRDLELAPLLFHTGIFSIKNYDRFSNTYFLHYPNKFIANYFENRVFKKIMQPLDMDLDYESFGDRCRKMMTNLLVGNENNVREYFTELGILANQKGYATSPRKPGKKNHRQDYYFKLEGAFQNMIQICLDCSKFGRIIIEKMLANGRVDIEFKIFRSAITILYELKVGMKNVTEGLNQLLQYAGAYLNDKETIVCIAVSFSKTTRKLDDWIYVEYDQKGNLKKIYAHKKHVVEELKLNLYDISIT